MMFDTNFLQGTCFVLMAQDIVLMLSWTDGVLVNYTNWEATFPVDNVQMPWKCGYSELTGEIQTF